MSDNNLRDDALDINKSFIVQAPAGSGKTELLTNRYLKLLATVKNPENILCLTFTKKAVAELKLRITESLQQAQQKKEPKEPHKKLNYRLATKVLEVDKKYNWHILTNISRIQVLTFDALTLKIANNYALDDLSNINIISSNINIYHNSAKKILADIEDSPIKDNILYLLKIIDNNSNTFIRIVATMLQERLKWLDFITDKNFNIKRILKTIDEISNNALKEIHQIIKTEQFLISNSNLFTVNDKLKSLKETTKDIKEYIDIANLLLTKNGQSRKTFSAKDGFNFKDSSQKVEFSNFVANLPNSIIKQLNYIRTIPRDIDVELLENIIKILITANFELENQFLQHQAMDYQQVSLLAQKNLANEEVSNIALSLDNRIEHILIDEFQDTSFTQLNLVESIVSNWEIDKHRTLFIVGDPMQSIYLFRGSQVEVFLSVRDNGIAHINLESLILVNNFRSNASIVENNNRVFSRIFSPKDDYQSGAIKYSPSKATNNNKKQAVFTHFFNLGEEERELENIKKIVLDNKNKSIAILGKNKNDFVAIAKKLSQNNISFSAYQNIKLIDDSFINDLVVICNILIDNKNKLAWLSLLRSPYIGLSLDQLLDFSNIDDIYQDLNNLNNPELVKLKNIFAYAFENLGVFDFVDIFLGLIENLGINQVINNTQQQSLRLFVGLLHDLVSDNELNIDSLKAELNNLFVPDIASNIKIMTIHQAKGLEFDVVILPNLSKKNRVDEKRLLYVTQFIGKISGMLIAPMDNSNLYEFLSSNYKKRIKAEELRLFYVAMTRAKEQIHLSSCFDKVEKGTFLALLEDFYDLQLKENLSTQRDKESEQKVVVNYKINNKLNSKLANITKHEHIKNPMFSEDDKLLGIILHRFLQYEQFNPSDIDVINQLKLNNITKDKFNNYQKFIQDALFRIKNSDDFEFIFKDRESTMVEQEIISDNKIYIIDRMFIDNNIIHIIDFKLNFNKTMIKKYQKQLKTYNLVVKTIYNCKYKVKTAIFSIEQAKLFYV